jgi:hypothetical protein
MLKTVEPTGDMCIKFTEEELAELGIAEGDKFRMHVNKDNSIILDKVHPNGAKEIIGMLFKELLDDVAFPEKNQETPEKAREYLYTVGFKVDLEAVRGVFRFVEQLREQT